MDNLFEKWKSKIPKYSEAHKDLFNSLSQKFGAEGEKKVNLGKHFSTNYELFMYAFFLGLYRNEFQPISEADRKTDFSHHIQHWGSKSNITTRQDFSSLQENMFIALLFKADLDLIALERGELSEDEAIRILIVCMESYANGGLILIREMLDRNPNAFLQPTSFLNMILEPRVDQEYTRKS